jgi:hypothetical protein
MVLFDDIWGTKSIFTGGAIGGGGGGGGGGAVISLNTLWVSGAFFLLAVCSLWFGYSEWDQCINFYLACNLLNLVFETSNTIHVKLCILYVLNFFLEPVWKPGPKILGRPTDAPKMARSAPCQPPFRRRRWRCSKVELPYRCDRSRLRLSWGGACRDGHMLSARMFPIP